MQTWSDRWQLVSTMSDGVVRKTTLTAVLKALDEPTDKPQAETWYVQSTIDALKQSIPNVQRIEALWDGNVILAS